MDSEDTTTGTGARSAGTIEEPHGGSDGNAASVDNAAGDGAGGDGAEPAGGSDRTGGDPGRGLGDGLDPDSGTGSGGPDRDTPGPVPPVPVHLPTDVRSVSAAREVDRARAWEASDRLARLALLMTGSPDRAYALTRRTLISVGRSGPYVQARRRLMRRAVRTRVDGYTSGLLPGLAGPTPAARLWRRLMRLPAVERALVVLTEAEGMADAVAGAVLGLPRVETEQTLARVRTSLEAHAQLTEAERREVFDGPALMPASGMVPTQALGRAQRSRRLRRTLTALAAVLVLAAGVLGVAEVRSDHGDLPLRVAPGPDRVTDPARWPARGDRLGDSRLLHTALRTWRSEGLRGDTGDLPRLLWAGRLTGGRSAVVLAGRTPAGDRVLGVLLDRGGQTDPALVRTVPVVPAPAVDLGAVSPDDPLSHRYLVAPWFSQLSVLDLAGPAPGGTELLGLHDGLSAAWSGPAGTCTHPLLELVDRSGPAPEASYALDAFGAGAVVPVSAPLADAARPAYLAALHGLTDCAADPDTAPPLLAGMPAGQLAVTRLDVTPAWSGRLPDRAAGQALRLSWRIDARSADSADTPVRFAQTFALVTGGAVHYAQVRVGAAPLDATVDGLTWTSPANHRRYLALLGGPQVARVDLSPRPKGFRPGRPAVFVGAPGHGQRLAVLGSDRTGRLLSVQPLAF